MGLIATQESVTDWLAPYNCFDCESSQIAKRKERERKANTNKRNQNNQKNRKQEGNQQSKNNLCLAENKTNNAIERAYELTKQTAKIQNESQCHMNEKKGKNK